MLERMVFYGHTGRCRWKVLLENFGEGEGEGFGGCASCDNCTRLAAAFAAVKEAGDEQAEAATGAMAGAAPTGHPGDVSAAGEAAGSRFAAGDAVSVRRYGDASSRRSTPRA